MSRPLLSDAVGWADLQDAVIAVLKEALARIAATGELPRTEDPLNLILFREARAVHFERLRQADASTLPFSIMLEASSQPEPDDVARCARLRKRPDLTCVLTDAQALDASVSQLYYYIECKRLGLAEGNWILNANYAQHGILRFVDGAWQYAKRCESATMVGYLQNMDPAAALLEVNIGVTAKGLPVLLEPAEGWSSGRVHTLVQSHLTRGFEPTRFSLGHLWVDLRGCQFNDAVVVAAPRRPRRVQKQRRRKTGRTN